MMSNSIISFSVGLLDYILQPFIQRNAYKASFLAHVISVHLVNGPVTLQVKGLSYVEWLVTAKPFQE